MKRQNKIYFGEKKKKKWKNKEKEKWERYIETLDLLQFLLFLLFFIDRDMRWGGSNEHTHNLCVWAKIRKIIRTPVNPTLPYINGVFQGVHDSDLLP